VVQHLDVKQLFQCGLDLLDTRVTKLQHFAGVGEDDVVVLLDPIALLVLRHFVAKLVFADEVAINEQIDGIVQRGPTYAVFVGRHVGEQRLNVEVPFVRINLTENGKPFRRFAVTVLLQVGFEQVPNPVAAALSALLLCFPAAGVSDLLMVWAKILRVLKIRNYAGNCVSRDAKLDSTGESVVSMSMKRSSGAS